MKKKNELKRYVLIENEIVDIKIEEERKGGKCYITNSGTLYRKYTYNDIDNLYINGDYINHQRKGKDKIGKVLFTTDNVETIINRFLSENKDFWCDIYYLHSSLLNRFNNSVKLNKKDLKSAYKIILYEYRDNKREKKEIKYTFLNKIKNSNEWRLYKGEV